MTSRGSLLYLTSMILCVLLMTEYAGALETTTEAETTTAEETTTFEMTTTEEPLEDQTLFYRHGEFFGDQAFYGTDDGSVAVPVTNGYSFLGEKFDTIYINTNGYVSLGDRYANARPTRLPLKQNNLIAPLWLDLDLTGSYGQESEGVIYYQRYEHFSTATLADGVLELYLTLQNEIQEAHGDTSFEPHLIIVITWINCPRHPYRESKEDRERASFQLVLTQDYRSDRSYALFLYGLIILTNYRIPNIQGYSNTADKNELLTSNITVAGLSMATGTAGRPGRWVFRTSSQDQELTEDSATYKCQLWATTQMDWERSFMISISDLILPSCPCSYFQGVFDGRFITSLDTRRDNCLVSIRRVFGTISRMCCYARSRRSMEFDRLDRSWTYEGGSILEYDPWLSYDQYVLYDDAPKRYCCQESNNCDIFYTYRPSDSCVRFLPPWFSWTWGDPHVATIDGKQYSFQGIGEFTLMESNVTIIQGRAEQTKDINNKTVAGTVWTGIAMKDISNTGGATPTVSVSLNTARMGLVINVQNDDLTDWFINSESTMTESNDVILLKNNTKVTIQLPSGMSVSVEVGVGQLVFSVVIPDNLQGYKIRGLLGNANRDANDDFQLPDDTILANDLTEERIYYDFALKWRVLGDSDKYLFSTAPVPVPTAYVPTFNEPNPVFSADESAVCGNDVFCLLDLRVTDNSDFASQTKEINSQNTVNQLELSKVVPAILGPDVVNITVGRTIRITLTSNNTASAVNFSVNTVPSGASLDAQTGVFTWQVPYLLSPVELIFGGKTEEGTEGVPLRVILTLCNCTEDTGSCTGETIKDLTTYFKMDMCRCLDMYEGEFCTEFRDYCGDSPCVPGAKCINLIGILPEDNPGYNCTDCPKGYKESIRNSFSKCDDVDECKTGDNMCDQNCINLDGSYKCECEAGYVLNNITECADINECFVGTATCEQICNNTDGSYACECYDGYTLLNNGTCVQDEATKIGCKNLTCAEGCRLNGSVPECFCQQGYQINPTETSLCDDIDECVGGTHTCGPNSTCVNLPGTYSCSCDNGYLLNDDQRTCRVCDPLYWGKNCSNMCTKCASAANCDPAIGCTKCTQGWTGKPHCNQDVKECDVNGSCPEHSTCEELPGNFRCTCDEGYRAKTTLCIDIDDCTEVNGTRRTSNPCNNGTCNDHLLGYNCTCFVGFTGADCTTNIDDCVNNTCQYGSTCVDLVNTYKCMCLPGFYGIFCEKSACVQPTVSGSEAVTHRGFLIVKNMEYDAKMADPDSDIFKDIYNKTVKKIILIYSCLENRTNTLFRDLNDVRFTETNSVNISWALVFTEAISEDVLVDALASRINLFTGLAFQNISYAVVIPPRDSTSNDLVIVLGTIGGLFGVVIIAVSVVMVMIRSRSTRRRPSPHVLDSTMGRIIGMQPHGRRWMDIPSLRTDVLDPVVIPRVVHISPRPMPLVTPDVDWNVLRQARNTRFGLTGRPTAARFNVSNSDLNNRRQLEDNQSKWTWSTADYSQNR